MTPKEFKKLQAKWYKKLADNGFEDIEDNSKPRPILKTWDSYRFRAKYTPEQFEAKQRYYELCLQMLETHTFKSARDKKIWKMHAEGAMLKEIAKAVKLSTVRVHHIVAELRKNISSRL